MREKSPHPLVELGVSFVAGIATYCAIASVVWYLRSNSEEGGTSSQPPNRFPWEPQQEGDPLPPPPKNTHQSTDDQLQFLAQMTFANGGMRAPSCLCCI